MTKKMTFNSSDQSSTETDEEWIEMGTEGNFQRAYRKGEKGPSPESTDYDKVRFIKRISVKAFRDEQRKNKELCNKIADLQKEIDDLNLQKQKHQEQQRSLHAILTDCSHVQLGNGNTIQIFNVDEPIPMFKKLMSFMQAANDQVIHRLTVSENNHNKSCKYLQKIHLLVEQLRENESSNSKTQMMDVLKEMVDIPIKGDDFSPIEEALKTLKTVKDFEHLQPAAKRGIRVLIYKFGAMTRQAFANALGQQYEKQHMSSEETLDENSCFLIILKWLDTHENDVSKLSNIFKNLENKVINDTLQNLKEETYRKVSVMQGNKIDVRSEISPSPIHLRKHQLGNSVILLRSNRSDVSDVSEAIENIEKHVSETLKKTDDTTPDMNALLCAVYTLVMDNTRMLNAVSEKLGVTDVNVKDIKAAETGNENEANVSLNHEENEERVEKYV